jgi:hypothetical protein
MRTDTGQERVTIYGVEREYSGEWRVVSATARVTDKLYIIDDRVRVGAFGYNTRIPKSDPRAFTSAYEAVRAAMRRAENSIDALNRKIAEHNRDIFKLGDLLASLDKLTEPS